MSLLLAAGAALVAAPTTVAAAPLDPVTFELVADIEDRSEESSITNFLVDGDITYFRADDGIHGSELWAYDETSGTAEMVADINPGPLSSAATPLAVVGGELYLSASDGVVGTELWAFDGVDVRLVADIDTGTANSLPRSAVVFDGVLHFTAEGDGHGRELWRTDGTSAGTVRLSSIHPTGDADVQAVTVVPTAGGPSRLYFTADDGATGEELYRYTVADGVRLFDLRPGADASMPFSLAAWDDVLVFVAARASGMYELHTTSGSESVAGDVKSFGSTEDIVGAYPAGTNLFVRSGTFGAYSLSWFDATEGDFELLAAGLDFFHTTPDGDRLLFVNEDTAEDELWISDGTPGGTNEVGASEKPAGIQFLGGSMEMTASGDFLILPARLQGVDNRVLLAVKVDGAAFDLLTDPDVGQYDLRWIETTGGRFLMKFGPDRSEELWVVDEVGAEVTLVDDINETTQGSSPRQLTSAGDRLFFTASTYDHGQELWALEPGGVPSLVSDIWPGPPSSAPRLLTASADVVYFIGEDSVDGRQIWVSDGTEAGTVEFVDMFPNGTAEYPTRIDATHDGVFFTTNDGWLWFSDGTPAGTVELVDLASFASPHVVADGLVFRGRAADDPGGALELWMSDGTPSGTGPAATFVAGLASGQAVSDVIDGRIHIRTPSSIWVTDGSIAGTEQVLDFAADNSVSGVFEVGGGRFILGESENTDGDDRMYVWFDPDGPTPPTVIVELDPNLSYVERHAALVVDDRLVLPEYDGDEAELQGFRVASTTNSTFLPISVAADADVEYSQSFDGVGYFLVTESDEHVAWLWGTNGTVDGTSALVGPIDVAAAAPEGFELVGDHLYTAFEASASPVGNELWQFDLPDPDPEPDPDPGPGPGPGPDPDPDPGPDPDPDPDPVGSEIESLTPGRIFASRATDETVDGRFEGGGRIAAASFVEVDVAGRAGVDGDARSVVMNVTAINPSGRGFVTVYPCGDRPLASSLNFGAAGAVVGNELVAKLSAAGTVCVFSSAETDLSIDVVGFVPATSGLVPLDPARVYASRSADETIDGRQEATGRVGAGSFVEVDVAGRAGIPASGAGAVVMNITAVNPSGRGFITVYPCGDRPLASSLNFGAAGAVVGNELVAKLSAAGTVCVYSSAETDLTVDAVGYVPSSSAVVSLDPARVFATRASDETVDGEQEAMGQIAASGVVEVEIAGRAGVPGSGAGAVVMNITAVNPVGRGFITVYPCGDRPLASSLNYGAAGAVVGNELIAKLSASGTVCVFTSAATDLSVDVVGYVPA
jgi:ELWxxDGT repeat protein